MLVPVILAGGSGTRLWPLSRRDRPKHLVALIGGETLLQQTARRVASLGAAKRLLVVGAERHAMQLRCQLEAVVGRLPCDFLLEPSARNTAAAVALAAVHAEAHVDRGDLLLVCPSDHLVARPGAFFDAVERARPLASSGEILTFGIRPDRPETGYGYIRAGKMWPGVDGARRVIRFVEKPQLEAAEEMLRAGDHFWNSGIFLFRVDRILEELAAHAPEVLGHVRQAYRERIIAPAGTTLIKEQSWAAVPALPIDRAVMERTARMAVVPCDPGWTDLGAWHALWEHGRKDAQQNAVLGDVALCQSRGNLVRSEGGRLVACVGVSDLAIIDTRDALLVAPLNDAEGIRTLVAALDAAARKEVNMDQGEDRPWGRFDVLHEGPGFKVKEIRVDPGGRLSLQSHEKRAEHWVVVRGKARVTIDDAVHDLLPNESVHVPLGAKHRIENPFDEPMHLIEVQCGGYLGEDDIIRYEDVYGRI